MKMGVVFARPMPKHSWAQSQEGPVLVSDVTLRIVCYLSQFNFINFMPWWGEGEGALHLESVSYRNGSETL